MSIEKIDLNSLILQNSITSLRENDGYQKLCEAHCKGMISIQNAVDFLTNALNVDKASGVFLDYIGWLVGTTRTSFSISGFFCVNSNDINVEKQFYFPTETKLEQGSLVDVIFRQRIKAKIGYNISKGTREDNLYIIKNLTNADKVVITKAGYKKLDVHLYGNNIVLSGVNSLRQDIEQILGLTIGLNNLEIN